MAKTPKKNTSEAWKQSMAREIDYRSKQIERGREQVAKAHNPDEIAAIGTKMSRDLLALNVLCRLWEEATGEIASAPLVAAALEA